MVRTYLFDLSGDPDWAGRITQLRLDPIATGTGASIAIDFVRLLTTSVPGDYNADGAVDTADYVAWRKSNIYGELGYELWRTNFSTPGSGSGVADVESVPEASTAAGLIIGAVLIEGFGGRRRLRAATRGEAPPTSRNRRIAVRVRRS